MDGSSEVLEGLHESTEYGNAMSWEGPKALVACPVFEQRSPNKRTDNSTSRSGEVSWKKSRQHHLSNFECARAMSSFSFRTNRSDSLAVSSPSSLTFVPSLALVQFGFRLRAPGDSIMMCDGCSVLIKLDDLNLLGNADDVEVAACDSLFSHLLALSSAHEEECKYRKGRCSMEEGRAAGQTVFPQDSSKFQSSSTDHNWRSFTVVALDVDAITLREADDSCHRPFDLGSYVCQRKEKFDLGKQLPIMRKQLIDYRSFAKRLRYLIDKALKNAVEKTPNALERRNSVPLVELVRHAFTSLQKMDSQFNCNGQPTDVKLAYYIASGSASRHEAALQNLSKMKSMRRYVPFTRDMDDEQEREAYYHRSMFQRFLSFARPGSTWKRSVQLAFKLAQLGFYYAPPSFQKRPLLDKIRCAFCRRGKLNWCSFPYPETLASYLRRPADMQVIVALARWHAIKSPTCPRSFGLQVDAIELTEEQSNSVRTVLKNPLDHLTLTAEQLCAVKRTEQKVNICESPTFEDYLWFADKTVNEFSGEAKSNKKLTLNQEAKLRASLEYEPLTDLSFGLPQCDANGTVKNPFSSAAKRCLFLEKPRSHKQTPCYPEFVSEDTRLATFYRLCSAVRRDGLQCGTTVFQAERVCDMNHANNKTDEIDLLRRLKSTGLKLGSQTWNFGTYACPKKLAAAGFFTMLNGFEIHCFCCSLSLVPQAGREPWLEHASRQPDCAFLRTVRGGCFVRQVQSIPQAQEAQHDRNGGPEQSACRHTSSSAYNSLMGFHCEPQHEVNSEFVKATALRYSQFLACSNFELSQESLEFFVEQQIRTTGRDFESLLDLVEAVRDVEVRMAELSIKNIRDFVQEFNTRRDAWKHKESSQQPVAESSEEMRKRDGQTNATAARMRESSSKAGPGALGQTNVENFALCIKCRQNTVSVTFLCGHFVVCESCSSSFAKCPRCHVAVTTTMRIFVP